MNETETSNIYQYSSARQFVLDKVSDLQKGRDVSLRSLAKEMGFASHTLLVMLLQGSRKLQVKHSQNFAKGFGLSSQERLYLQALIQFETSDDLEEKQLCQIWLSELHPGQQHYHSREVDELNFYSHWIHTAILAATYTKKPLYSAKDVAQLFSGLVSLTEAHAAIERLLALELLNKNDEGRLVSSYQKLSSKNDILNKGIQAYHKASSEQAIRALDELALEKREFQSLSLPVPHDKIPQAKEMIRKFRSRFAKEISHEIADDVFQLNIQFFQLSDSFKGENHE